MMTLKAILNRCHRFSSFVYGEGRFVDRSIHVDIKPRKGNRPICAKCFRRGAIYDTSRTPRCFEFIPLWGFAVMLWYCMRRVDCDRCGVTTEVVPWADGKNRTCDVYRLFLARWAKRMSWTEVAVVFHTSWGVVYRAVQWVVHYGLENRNLNGIEAIGVDEIAVWKGQKYLTVVYQIDKGVRRLLWVARERTEESLSEFFDILGETRTRAIRFVASDMWQPYLAVIVDRVGQAIHVLDRFHIAKKLGEAVDEIRAAEAKDMARKGFEAVLKHSRWCFLKREENLTKEQGLKLKDVLQYDLRTVRAYLLKQSFDHFWSYKSAWWAGWFLDKWCLRAMRSRLEPMKKFVGTIRGHRELLLNWFRARGELAAGAVEGLNTNAKLALRKARGFRTYQALETALYHQMGHLPEPEFAHEFC
jgi:transposase